MEKNNLTINLVIPASFNITVDEQGNRSGAIVPVVEMPPAKAAVAGMAYHMAVAYFNTKKDLLLRYTINKEIIIAFLQEMATENFAAFMLELENNPQALQPLPVEPAEEENNLKVVE